MKYPVHHVHEHSWSICQAERHNYELIKSIAGSECCFLRVLFSDPQLVISGPKINLGETLGPFKLIEQVTDLGQRVFILYRYCVLLSIVDTQSERTILLLSE